MIDLTESLRSVSELIAATDTELEALRTLRDGLVTEALNEGSRWSAINEACGVRNMQATYKRRTSN